MGSPDTHTWRSAAIGAQLDAGRSTERAVPVQGASTEPLLEPLVGEPGTTTITEERTETEDGPVAHIVKTRPGEDATAKVLAARVEGTPLEALCGHVWVPNRDPKKLPVCQRCKDIYGMYREFNDGLGENPRS